MNNPIIIADSSFSSTFRGPEPGSAMQACHSSGRRRTSASDVQAFAARALDFLQLIEKTIRRLQADTDAMRAYAIDIERMISDLSSAEFDAPIDAEGRICDQLQRASEAASRIHKAAALGYESARSDPELTDEDGVVQAFRQFMDTAARYHNAVEDLRDTVETLDAMHSPRVAGGFTNAADLMKHLLAS